MNSIPNFGGGVTRGHDEAMLGKCLKDAEYVWFSLRRRGELETLYNKTTNGILWK